MKVVSPKEMARVEKLAYAEGFSEETFMNNAGTAIANYLKDLPSKPKITLLCGSGNNGGDAYVAGRVLKKAGFEVIAFGAPPQSPLCQLQQKRFGKIRSLEEATFENTLILDGLFGTGFRGELEEPYKSVIDKANRSGAPIVAIDISSGGAVQADATLALGLPKTSCFECWENTGRLTVHDFGLEEKFLEQATAEFELIEEVRLPPIQRTRHKYQAGYVVGIGGSPGMPGAAILSSFAALRAGAGIVRLYHQKGMEAELSQCPPEVIRHGFTSAAELQEAVSKADAVFIGPGFGLERVELLKELLPMAQVIDAEALTLIGEHHLKPPAGAILTPHTGEMKRLGGDPQAYAEEHQVIVVLKGAPTYIYSPGRKPFIMARGDPGMATAGAGDVLTGIIAAWLAQIKDPLQAAVMGSYIHGLAGELAAERLTSYALVASDITEALPEVYSRCH